MDKSRITASEARQIFSYDQDTGVISWAIRPSSKYLAGSVAGCISSNGYVVIRFAGKQYKAHRLAWAIVTGEWPALDVDHRDGNRSNNRWSNLRQADASFNQQNQRKAQITNRSGFLGVVPHKSGKFVAQIKHKGTNEGRYIGMFATAAEAHQAYLQVKRKTHAGSTI